MAQFRSNFEAAYGAGNMTGANTTGDQSTYTLAEAMRFAQPDFRSQIGVSHG